MDQKDEVIQLLIQNKDLIKKLLNTFKAIDDAGYLDAIKALAEASESIFLAMNKPEVMGTIGNLMVLLYLINNIDQSVLMDLSVKLPKAINSISQEIKKEPVKLGFFEMIKIMRSPEFATLLKALQSMMKIITYKE